MVFSIATRSVPRLINQRAFSVSAVHNKDLVQDLYLSQLKAYKAPQKPADAHVGQVKTFKEPQAPSAPSVPSDLASELSAYDAAQPTFQQSASSSEVDHQQEGGDADSFLAFLEQDLPKDEAHH